MAGKPRLVYAHATSAAEYAKGGAPSIFSRPRRGKNAGGHGRDRAVKPSPAPEVRARLSARSDQFVEAARDELLSQKEWSRRAAYDYLLARRRPS